MYREIQNDRAPHFFWIGIAVLFITEQEKESRRVAFERHFAAMQKMKNGMRRFLSMLLAMVFIALALPACNNGSTNDTDTTDDTTEKPALTEIGNSVLSPSWYYQNPLTGSAADPMIVEHEGTYYLYSTGGTKLSVRTSKNLKTWSSSKQIFALSQTSWGVDCCWAPEVHEYNGKFYLFFCGRDSNKIFHGSVAVCDTPDGTFKPITDTPLLNFSYSVIDLSFFEDDDGKTYIFYSKDCSTNKIGSKKVSQSFGIEVSNDFTKLIGEPVLCSEPTQAWETVSGNTIWNEGPVVFKRNGTYYLLFSANYYQSKDYAVGYCTSDTVLGLYDKPKDSCILKGNGETITGSGHCNLLFLGDEIYLTYHSHTVPPNTDGGRSLYIDKLIIEADGSLHANGPTNTKQPLPDGFNGTQKYTGPVEISGKFADGKEQDVSVLADEVVAKGLTGIVKMADGDSVTFKFAEAQKFNAMWVHPSRMSGYAPGTVDVVINNAYVIYDVKFSAIKGSPATVVFAKLPEGTLIEEITLIFEKAEEQELSAISEVTFVKIEK